MAEHWIVKAGRKRFISGASRDYLSTEDYEKYVNNAEDAGKYEVKSSTSTAKAAPKAEKPEEKEEDKADNKEKKKDMFTIAIELGKKIMNANKKKSKPTAATAIRG
jgi:hypothetical protein